MKNSKFITTEHIYIYKSNGIYIKEKIRGPCISDTFLKIMKGMFYPVCHVWDLTLIQKG